MGGADAWIEGQTSAEMRALFMQRHLVPLARDVFAADPEVQSLMMVVGQFWCNDAKDAVHWEMIPCADRDPKWPECLTDERFFKTEEGWLQRTERAEALSGREAGQSFPMLDENGAAITAFGAFCIQGCDQEMPIDEAHVPYAIARRSGTEHPDVQVVGEMHQPHWEDRFDVGFDAEDA